MLCNECGKDKAEFYYKHTVNGNTSEYALCSECASRLKKEGKLNVKLPMMFDDFSFGVLPEGLYKLNGLFGSPYTPKRTEKKKCTLCASTFDELVKNGRVGCAKCYEVFADELAKSIESIHGKAKYAGRRTNKPCERCETTDKLTELKNELKKAIKEQEFERAAVLRDEIKQLENRKDGE